jgi:hypothetical protein
MKTHELKTDPKVFEASWAGCKPWEIRKNDRNFQVGDTLLLRETQYSGEEMAEQWTPHMADMVRENASVSPGKPLIYTGRELKVKVTYILGNFYELKYDWVVMTVEKLEEPSHG